MRPSSLARRSTGCWRWKAAYAPLLLKRRLDIAVRLMLEGNKDERSLTDIAKCCGFGGTSQFGRAFRARFGVPPRQYLALVRQQDLDWHEARLMADGFDQNALKNLYENYYQV